MNTTPTRRHAIVALTLSALLAGCSTRSRTPSSAAAGTTTVAPTASAPNVSPSEPTTSTVETAVGATGSLLRPPPTPVTIPARGDCHRLLSQPAATATISACATATGSSGTVTGTDEGDAHTQQWDVWKRNGNDADLVLTYTGNFQSTPGFVFHDADVAHDGDTKLLAIEHAPGVEIVTAVDIIETSGAVVAHIPVGANGGVVGPATGGGIETWTPAGTGSDTASIIRYSNGAWRNISARPVSANQVPTYPNDDGFGGGLP